ncbi:MAG: TadE family protein [Gemmatimonadota bacterium]
MVEFAIIIPILLAVLLGIVEFARAWQIQQVVTNAAREGARVAVTGNNDSAAPVDAAIDTYLRSATIDMNEATWTFNTQSGQHTGQADTVTVSYNYTYSLFGPVMNLLSSGGSTPGSVTLSSTSIMRQE